MGILDMWREARGSVMRKEYEDAMARMQGANAPARSAFLNNIHQTIGEMITAYASTSKSERKTLVKDLRKAMLEMWNSGDWPSALGLGISCLNAESRLVPGDDAAYVRLETDKLIKEAEEDAHIE